ncbi:MAG: hypothetical protein HN704_03130 [Bacteroidetes bacterium]|jgi:hypothetical protein|nr:hypothetical protein [Bacteroidota bacterium]MBT6686997.1 hypothetical protein [Bacteroidota bacterium]MBT7142401.1 hypothetical protein [Bacteroidota bacterium]MBT7490582.1 hypothetical protein [Bacteroidota bacterium]
MKNSRKLSQIFYTTLGLLILLQLSAISQNTKTESSDIKHNIIEKEIVTESDSIANIETKQGSTIIGRIIKKGNVKIVIESYEFGEITILLENIKNLEIVSSDRIINGKYWFENPHDSRYFFGPTARSLKKGGGYFQNMELILMSANYGITDNISIGGGFSIMPDVEISKQLFFFQPKIGFQISEKISAGGGLFLFGASEFLGSIVYGNLTYGNSDINETIGLGIVSLDDEFLKYPILMISGMQRLSPRIALVTENWIFSELQIVSAGIRFFGQKISVDLALINLLQDPIFPGIPYVDFVFKF